MACQHVILPAGGRAIVCGSIRRRRCACGRAANLLCDWKAPTKSGTCDAPICRRCATSPAAEKDLCPKHAAAFTEWKARRAASSGGEPDAAPLTDPDAPTFLAAGVSATKAAQSEHALAAAKPEPTHA